MTTGELVAIVFSSSVLASVVTVVLGGFVNRLLKKLDYADDYYKAVLNRRLETYEAIEEQIVLLKYSVLDVDGGPYHLIFANGLDEFHKVLAGMSKVMTRNLWIGDQLQQVLVEINHELLDISFRINKENDLIKLGQERYERFAMLRHDLEHAYISDIQSLHMVRKFFDSKKQKEHQFIPFSVSQRSGCAQQEPPSDNRTSHK